MASAQFRAATIKANTEADATAIGRMLAAPPLLSKSRLQR
eukprot:CAMPEP_0180516168 /NCGR_PEP_ID=MMETSP1036_2-20121128/53752_1 /TAXON_ID=632150 /ORGANISM="Azadinium spinosum, Strain 3D9" /LENGTH=39 /DNA_ID= /DNA_START= /DNA_END= /DNA_ORIENTATION=